MSKNLISLITKTNNYLGKDCLGRELYEGDLIHSGDWNKLGILKSRNELYEFNEITKVIGDSNYSYRTNLEFDRYQVDSQLMKTKSILLVKSCR